MKHLPLAIFLLFIAGCSGVGLSRLINTGDYEALSKLSYDEINEITFNSTVLSRYVMQGDKSIEKLKVLLKYKADPNVDVTPRPLEFSVINSNYEFVKLLIAHGANIDHEDFYGKTALHYAVQNNDYQMVRLLLASGAKTGFLTKNYSSQNQNGISELTVAVINGNKEIVNALIEYGVNPNLSGDNKGFPILESVYKNEYEITDSLIKSKADVNIKNINGLSPLHIAIINQNERILSLLIDSGADCNSISNDTVSLLQEASNSNNLDIVNKIISCGASINQKNKYGLTALHYAAYNKNNKVTEALIASGADKQALIDIAKLEEQSRVASANASAASNAENSWISYMLVGLMNVAANAAYPSVDYVPKPIPTNPLQHSNKSNMSFTQHDSSVLPNPNYVGVPLGCNSDFECGIGRKCVKGPLQGQGQCLTPVNQYGTPQPGVMPTPNSIMINTNIKGACQFDTQCGVGFRCDQELKVCVQ